MMKPGVSISAFLLIASAAVATASSALATCTPPPADFAPVIPDGAVASELEMAIAAEQVESYVRVLTAFIDCTDDEIGHVLEDPEPDVDRAQFVAMIDQRADAVDRRGEVLRGFEYQLHLLEARAEQAGEFAAGADSARIVAEEVAELLEALRTLERSLSDEATEPLWQEGEDSPDGETSEQ